MAAREAPHAMHRAARRSCSASTSASATRLTSSRQPYGSTACAAPHHVAAATAVVVEALPPASSPLPLASPASSSSWRGTGAAVANGSNSARHAALDAAPDASVKRSVRAASHRACQSSGNRNEAADTTASLAGDKPVASDTELACRWEPMPVGATPSVVLAAVGTNPPTPPPLLDASAVAVRDA